MFIGGNMTDNEIIKALEICGNYKGKCTDCPAYVKVDRSLCNKVLSGALEIINRQKAEIEKYAQEQHDLMIEKDELFDIAEKQKAEIERLKDFATSKCEDCAGCTSWKCDCANIKAEAIKEFAKMLRANKIKGEFAQRDDCYVNVINIDQLEEMAGEE